MRDKFLNKHTRLKFNNTLIYCINLYLVHNIVLYFPLDIKIYRVLRPLEKFYIFNKIKINVYKYCSIGFKMDNS